MNSLISFIIIFSPMILKYSATHEELIFSIRYLSLPLNYIEHDGDLTLMAEDSAFEGTHAVLTELLKLCKCDPHDLSLLNTATIKDIRIIHNTPVKSYLKTLFNNQISVPENNRPSSISLTAHVNKQSFTIADIFLFAKVYKALLEGTKLDTMEWTWFSEFQDALNRKMTFKRLEDVDFEFLEFRVGHITAIENHAENLFAEKVMFKDEQRTVVSGLRAYYESSELLGKYCIFATNLKKSKLRGTESQGMILCVKSGDTLKVLESPINEEGATVQIMKSGIDVIKHFKRRVFDGKSEQFRALMAQVKVRNHVLTFNGEVLRIRGKEVVSKIKDGDVS